MGQATSAATTRQVGKIMNVLAENLRRSATQIITTAYRVQINKGQHKNISSAIR